MNDTFFVLSSTPLYTQHWYAGLPLALDISRFRGIDGVLCVSLFCVLLLRQNEVSAYSEELAGLLD